MAAPIGIVLKFTYALVAVGASLVYLLLPRRVLTQTDAADYEIYVLIPLLREQRCLRSDLFCRFTSFLQEFPNLRLMFVTTHREEVEGPSRWHSDDCRAVAVNDYGQC